MSRNEIKKYLPAEFFLPLKSNNDSPRPLLYDQRSSDMPAVLLSLSGTKRLRHSGLDSCFSNSCSFLISFLYYPARSAFSVIRSSERNKWSKLAALSLTSIRVCFDYRTTEDRSYHDISPMYSCPVTSDLAVPRYRGHPLPDSFPLRLRSFRTFS